MTAPALTTIETARALRARGGVLETRAAEVIEHLLKVATRREARVAGALGELEELLLADLVSGETRRKVRRAVKHLVSLNAPKPSAKEPRS